MSGAPLVHCSRHGDVAAAYVCLHSLHSLQSGLPAGLYWSRDREGRFNGWCEACEAFLDAHGGGWNDETEAFARVTLICEQCFRTLADMNGVTGLPPTP